MYSGPSFTSPTHQYGQSFGGCEATDALEPLKVTDDRSDPIEYCVVHDQPLDWCKDQDGCRETMRSWGMYRGMSDENWAGEGFEQPYEEAE